MWAIGTLGGLLGNAGRATAGHLMDGAHSGCFIILSEIAVIEFLWYFFLAGAASTVREGLVLRRDVVVGFHHMRFAIVMKDACYDLVPIHCNHRSHFHCEMED